MHVFNMIECNSYTIAHGCESDNSVHIHKTSIYSHVINYHGAGSKLCVGWDEHGSLEYS
jgi:hypothetical protein